MRDTSFLELEMPVTGCLRLIKPDLGLRVWMEIGQAQDRVAGLYKSEFFPFLLQRIKENPDQQNSTERESLKESAVGNNLYGRAFC